MWHLPHMPRAGPAGTFLHLSLAIILNRYQLLMKQYGRKKLSYFLKVRLPILFACFYCANVYISSIGISKQYEGGLVSYVM